MAEQWVKSRIQALCKARGWTCYRLAKESGIPYSTLNTMLNKAGTPSVASLEKLCSGFGITLGQFFAENDDQALLTPEQRELLEKWKRLSEDDRAHARAFVEFLNSREKN